MFVPGRLRFRSVAMPCSRERPTVAAVLTFGEEGGAVGIGAGPVGKRRSQHTYSEHGVCQDGVCQHGVCQHPLSQPRQPRDRPVLFHNTGTLKCQKPPEAGRSPPSTKSRTALSTITTARPAITRRRIKWNRAAEPYIAPCGKTIFTWPPGVPVLRRSGNQNTARTATWRTFRAPCKDTQGTK